MSIIKKSWATETQPLVQHIQLCFHCSKKYEDKSKTEVLFSGRKKEKYNTTVKKLNAEKNPNFFGDEIAQCKYLWKPQTEVLAQIKFQKTDMIFLKLQPVLREEVYFSLLCN